MALKSLDGAFGIVASVDVGRGEFDGASVAADGGFELARCLIVEDVPVYVNDLGVFPTLVNVLVGFDEIVGFARFHALGVDVIAVKFNSHHDVFVSPSRDDRKATSLICVHSLFCGIIDMEIYIPMFGRIGLGLVDCSPC